MKKILAVDNNPVILKMLAEFLSRQGHGVLTAQDGLAALEILKDHRPDLIIVDLVMPNIGGEQLCRILRSRPELKTIPIVIYSAIDLEDEAAILAMGADACIAKGPFKETERYFRKVLSHIDNNTLPELSGMILGADNLCNRQIISELIFSRRHYENIFDAMPEGLVEFTPDWRIFHVNAAAVRLCGHAEETLLGAQFHNLFAAKDQERLQALLNNMGEEPAVVDEGRPVSLNGHEISLTFLPIRDDTHEFVVAILRDLTEKIRTERELELLRRQQERILNTVSEGIFGLDTTNRISFVNPAAHSMHARRQAARRRVPPWRDGPRRNHAHRHRNLPEKKRRNLSCPLHQGAHHRKWRDSGRGGFLRRHHREETVGRNPQGGRDHR